MSCCVKACKEPAKYTAVRGPRKSEACARHGGMLHALGWTLDPPWEPPTPMPPADAADEGADE